MATTENSVFDLIIEARSVTLGLSRAGTDLTLTWSIPPDYKVYAGAIVLVSTEPLNPTNFPTDGVRYVGSSDLQAPQSVIGTAQVVAAFYSQFGDNIDQTSIIVTNADPNATYYASIHISSNVLQYHTAGIHSYPLDNSFGQLPGLSSAGSIKRDIAPPTNPSLGTTYYNQIDGKVYMWNGTSWIIAVNETIQTGVDFPTTPVEGQFFYNSQTQALYIWNGSIWNKANTHEEGSPMFEKIGIGTDGSYDERAELIRVLKIQMGWPSVCVELSEDAFNVAIDNALDELRRRADNAYRKMYVLFTINKDQTMYYLNDPRNGTDKIVNVVKIHRVNTLGSSTLGGDNGVYSQVFFNQYYSGNMIDILSLHLISSMSEEFERIFAGNLMFSWNEMNRQLIVERKLYRTEKVVIECVMERTEQDLLVDRWAKQWLQSWAHAELKEMLGMIRSKYPTLPGPNGGVSLNGDMLIQEARQDFEECLRQIKDFEVGNGGVEFGNTAFLIG